MKLFFHKWWSWLFPRKGWRQDYIDFKKGKNAWEVPGKPEADLVFPYPLAWIPHTLDTDHPRGFEFLETTCVESGAPIGAGTAMACLRCGVHLHPKYANMVGGYDPPYCRRCRSAVKRAT